MVRMPFRRHPDSARLTFYVWVSWGHIEFFSGPVIKQVSLTSFFHVKGIRGFLGGEGIALMHIYVITRLILG